MNSSGALRPCLLVNPRSFRASRMGMARRAARLASMAGLEVHEVLDPASLRARLDRLRESGAQQIWVLAGDGTIHALAEYFAEAARDWSPALLFLAGGRANVVPREVGGYPALPALRRALANLRAGIALREDRMLTLQISQSGRATRYGFVFAGALVHEAVRQTAASRAVGRGWLRHSLAADPYVLLRWAVRTLVFRQPLPTYPDVAARLAGAGEMTGSLRALVATTLEMRKALYNPFATRGAGPVRFTAITTATPIWRKVPALLKGRFDDTMGLQQGFLSGRGERAEVRGIDSYALDGELFEADPTVPVVLTAGTALRVLCADP
jgi:hypothetical protein